MKINYTNYMAANKQPSTMGADEKRKIAAEIKQALRAQDLHGHVDVIYYEEAALIRLDGEYYNMWSYGDKAFFSGHVGDYRPLSER